MKLRKLSDGRYQIAAGPAAGIKLWRSTNPTALPCFRWCHDAPYAVAVAVGNAGFTLRGLARRIDRASSTREEV